MQAATDTNSHAESAARQYTDLETVRRRLIELEKTRIFSDEDLALLLRKSAQTNLKGGIETLNFSRRSGTSSDRTAGGRTVIRSWSPAALEEPAARQEASHIAVVDDGWKQFVAKDAPVREKEVIEVLEPSVPAFYGRRLRRPSRLKRLQNRNPLVAILANIIFIPKQAMSSLVSLVAPQSNSRAC